MTHFGFALSPLLVVLLSPHPIASQVVTDGSVGSAVTLNGADIEVGQNLGARVGDNLFHSFDRFSVAADQEVTFTGDQDIANVISRVTGGEISTIAGSVRSEIGTDGFFFINPSGVIIEESASIDVPAALHVSNASSIRFEDGSEWSTADPSQSSLSIAAPESFGFLGAASTGVHINGADLAVADAAALDVVGVNVVIEDAAITAPDGTIRAQAAGAGNVPADLTASPRDGALTIRNSAFSGRNASLRFGGGAIAFDSVNVAATDVTGAPSAMLITGASVDLSGVFFELAPDDVEATTILALSAGGDITIGGASDLSISGDVPGIDTETLLVLNAGGTITISDQSALANLSGADATGGQVFVQAADMVMRDGASILSDTTSGVGGLIDMRLGTLTLDGSSIAASATEDGGFGGAIAVNAAQSVALDGGRISGSAAGGADGGLIAVISPLLTLANGASIEADIFGDGSAGVVGVEVGDLALTGGAFISADVFEDGGASGLVDIVASGAVSLSEASFISSSSVEGLEIVADGGFVQMRAGSLTLDGGSFISTSVFSGQAGAVNATVGSITLRDGSRITSNAVSAGFAGDLTIETNDLSLLTGSRIASTGVGAAGSGFINLTADNIVMTDGSAIANITEGETGGGVTINAATLTMGDDRDLSEIAIATEIAADSVGAGDAGAVSITVGELTASNSEISADAFGDGNAGGVTIAASGNVLLNGRTEVASRSNDGGAAGAVSLSAPLIIVEQGAEISSEGEGASNSGLVQVRADDLRLLNGGRITSDVEDGLGGLVLVTAGDLFIIDDFLPEFADRFTEIAADSTGTGQAGSVSVTANRMLIQGGFIVADSLGAGPAGDVNVTVNEEMLITRFGQIASSARSGEGDAGDVEISAPVMTLAAAGSVSTTATGAAAGGRITITADELTIQNGAGIRSDVVDGPGGIVDVNVGVLTMANEFLPEFEDFFTEISAETFGEGLAGSIDVNARRIQSQGAFISTDSLGAGDAGDVTLVATRSIDFSQGDARSNAVAGLGAAGDVFVSAPIIRLTNQGQITTSATGTAPGGIITLEGGRLIINDGGVTSITRGSGVGGDIAVGFETTFDRVALRNGGTINASSLDGGGPAGIVEVNANEIILNGGSEISTASRGAPLFNRRPNEGRIELNAPFITLRDGSSVTAEGSELGDGGDIEINASDLLVTGRDSRINSSAVEESDSIIAGIDEETEVETGDAGSILMTVDTLALTDGGSVTTRAEGGAGGAITVNAAEEITMIDGEVITSVSSGEENGGNVTLTVNDGFIVLHQGSEILAQAVGGDGGAMLITMDALYRSRSTRIDASSTLGFAGPVVISGLENPETSEAGVLPSDFLDANAIVRNPCLAAFLGRSQLQIVETGVSAASPAADSPLLDAATSDGLTLVGGDLAASAAGCEG